MAEWGEGRSLALEVGALTAGGLCRRRDLFPTTVVILNAGCFLRDQDWDGLFKQDEATDSQGEGHHFLECVGVDGKSRGPGPRGHHTDAAQGHYAAPESDRADLS